MVLVNATLFASWGGTKRKKMFALVTACQSSSPQVRSQRQIDLTISRIPSFPLRPPFHIAPRRATRLRRPRPTTISPLLLLPLFLRSAVVAVVVIVSGALIPFLPCPFPLPRLRPLLDPDVEALPAQRLEQGAAGAHAGEVLGGEDAEDVGDDVGDAAVHGAGLHVGRVDAEELEAQAVAAWGAAAEVREDEEGARDAVLVFGLVRRGDEGAHQPPGGGHVRVRGRHFGLVVAAVWAQERAVQGEHADVVLGWRARGLVCYPELQDRRRIDDPTISLAEATGSGGGGLLADA